MPNPSSFSLGWRLGAAAQRSGMSVLATSDTARREAVVRDPAGKDVAQDKTALSGTVGIIASARPADETGGALWLGWFGASYNRIWVIPAVLTAQNPRIGVGIPFNIWNAFSRTNVLDNIVGTDATGLTFDLAPGNSLRGIEFREVNITIGPTAPISINASFVFDFHYGDGKFVFKAVIADFVQMRPDPPVTEVWDWLTDVLVSHDGTEQRIALRQSPRRATSYEIGLESQVDRRQQYNRWFKSLATRLVFPYYQYSARVLTASLTGSTKVYFDPAATDVRAGSYIVVLNESTETGALVKILTVDVDGITADAPLQFDVTAGSIVAPAFSSRIENNSGFDMFMVHGTLKVEAQALDVREQFSRPGTIAVVNHFNGFPVLDRRPTASAGPSSDRFDVNYEVIDSQTGLLDIKSSWPHPFITAGRRFAFKRHQDVGEMDWWRDFCDAVKGMQKPFYFPTWFNDLPVLTQPTAASNTLRVSHPDYMAAYFPYETYKQIQIELADGRVLWRNVLTGTQDVPGETTLSLDGVFGALPADLLVAKVSYLNLSRLGSDRVSLMHWHLRTEVSLSIRTTDNADDL